MLSKQWPSCRQRAVSKNLLLYKDIILWTVFSNYKYILTHFWPILPFYAYFAEFKRCWHIRLHRRQGNYDKKNPSNLCKNCLVSKRYIISKEIVMENYKWCLRKQFPSFVKLKYRPHVWQDTKDLISGLSFLQ